jgi:uncharacterized protein Veg
MEEQKIKRPIGHHDEANQISAWKRNGRKVHRNNVLALWKAYRSSVIISIKIIEVIEFMDI